MLVQAIEEARRLGVPIVTAKLDRLARSVSAICAIRESGVRFVALDLPETENPLFLYVVAALAEYEAKLISERTKAALAAKRARGWKQQPPVPFTPAAAAKGQLVSWTRAVAREQKMAAHAETLLELGLSLDKVAERLNAEGYRREQGGLLDRWAIRNALDRRAEAQGRVPAESKLARRKRERLDRRIHYANLREAERRKRRNEQKARREQAKQERAIPCDGSGLQCTEGEGGSGRTDD